MGSIFLRPVPGLPGYLQCRAIHGPVTLVCRRYGAGRFIRGGCRLDLRSGFFRLFRGERRSHGCPLLLRGHCRSIPRRDSPHRAANPLHIPAGLLSSRVHASASPAGSTLTNHKRAKQFFSSKPGTSPDSSSPIDLASLAGAFVSSIFWGIHGVVLSLCFSVQGSYGRSRSRLTAFVPFGISGSGSPARRFSTRRPTKSAKGLISSPTLAFSREPM